MQHRKKKHERFTKPLENKRERLLEGPRYAWYDNIKTDIQEQCACRLNSSDRR
jgi:hypothetical protein